MRRLFESEDWVFGFLSEATTGSGYFGQIFGKSLTGIICRAVDSIIRSAADLGGYAGSYPNLFTVRVNTKLDTRPIREFELILSHKF